MARAPIVADDGLDLERSRLVAWTRELIGRAERLFVGPADGPAGWLVAARRLEFDSRVFGLPCGRLDFIIHDRLPGDGDGDGERASEAVGRSVVGRPVDWLKARGVGFISAKVDGRDLLGARVLEELGFRLMDVSTIHRLDLVSGLPPKNLPDGFSLRPAREGDVEAMAGLAASAMTDVRVYQDRFALDPVLGPGAEALYNEWWRASVGGDEADEVWVLVHEGTGVGFITLCRPEEAESRLTGQAGGWVVLNGLAPEFRGRGLYRPMVIQALYRLRDLGCSSARVKTKLSQFAVQRVWQVLGARLSASSFVFHLHL